MSDNVPAPARPAWAVELNDQEWLFVEAYLDSLNATQAARAAGFAKSSANVQGHRLRFTDIHPTGIGPQREPGIFSASAPMAGYPKVYNIEMDPHEDLVVGGLFGWVSEPALKVVEEYLETVKKYPNPPAPNITQFRAGGG